MTETPVIVISSAKAKSGKTTLALNLAAALWADGYKVQLFAPESDDIRRFLQQRIKFCQTNKVALEMPDLLDNLADSNTLHKTEKSVIIADIPSLKNAEYAYVFNKAHTLITLGLCTDDLLWKMSDEYISIIWNAKKEIAARGIKYMNWITLLNKCNKISTKDQEKLLQSAKKFGFRLAEPLHNRDAYCHIEKGYCTADMALNKVFNMSFADVYARREILTLSDFLWQNK